MDENSEIRSTSRSPTEVLRLQLIAIFGNTGALYWGGCDGKTTIAVRFERKSLTGKSPLGYTQPVFVATGRYGDNKWQFHGEGYDCKRGSGIGVYTVARRRLKAKATVESETDSDAKGRGDDYLQLRPKRSVVEIRSDFTSAARRVSAVDGRS